MLLWRLDRAARLEAELFVHGRLAVQRKEVTASAVRESAAAGLAAMLGEADGRRREARFQAKRAIDADIRAQAPSAQVLVEREESAKTFDRLARHEGTLQRALNRTLEDFRGLRREAKAAAAEAASAGAASAEAAPGPVTAPPGGAGPAARSGAAAPAGEDALLQNEADSPQALDAAKEPPAGADPPAGPPGGNRASEPSGTGPRSGPAGAPAPARRKARSVARIRARGRAMRAERAPGD